MEPAYERRENHCQVVRRRVHHTAAMEPAYERRENRPR